MAEEAEAAGMTPASQDKTRIAAFGIDCQVGFCTPGASLFVPGAGIRIRLEKGANPIELPAMPPGTLSYTCSMGMYGGRITVVERPPEPAGG